MAIKVSGAGSGTANGQTPVLLNVNESDVVAFQVTGTFVGTVTFQATIDGTNWVALSMTPSAGGAAVTTAAAAALVRGVCSGYSQVRAQVTAFTSGTIVVSAIGFAV